MTYRVGEYVVFRRRMQGYHATNLTRHIGLVIDTYKEIEMKPYQYMVLFQNPNQSRVLLGDRDIDGLVP